LSTQPSLDRFNRIVVKVGSSLLVDRTKGALKQEWLDALVVDLAALSKNPAALREFTVGNPTPPGVEPTATRNGRVSAGRYSHISGRFAPSGFAFIAIRQWVPRSPPSTETTRQGRTIVRSLSGLCGVYV